MSNLSIWLKLRQLISEATVVGINFRKLVHDPCVSDFMSDGLDKAVMVESAATIGKGFSQIWSKLVRPWLRLGLHLAVVGAAAGPS